MRQDRPLKVLMHTGIPLLAFGLTALLPLGTGGWSYSIVLFGWVSFSLLSMMRGESGIRQDSVDLIGALALVSISGGVYSPFSPLLPVVIVFTAARHGTGAGLIRASVASLVVASSTTLVSSATGTPAIEQSATPLLAMALALHGVALLSGRLNHRWKTLEEEHDLIIHALEEGIIVTDGHGRVRKSNPSARKLLEFPEQTTWQGKKLDELLRRSHDTLLKEAILIPGSVSRCVDWSPRQGETKSFQLRTTEVAAGLKVTVFADRTVQKRVLETEARLSHLRELEELALGLAHEIRNPLASLRGAAMELAKGNLKPSQSERMEAIVQRESNRLDRTVDEFLEYSRSRRTENTGTVEVAVIVEEMMESIAQRSDASGVVLELEVSSSAPIQGDRDGIHQLVSNLAINALEAKASHIDFKIDLRGGNLRLTVADDGHGMSRDMLARSFLPFVSTKPREGGLGLALVKKIVDGCGGWIEAKSQEGEGTTFEVSLPLTDQECVKAGS